MVLRDDLPCCETVLTSEVVTAVGAHSSSYVIDGVEICPSHAVRLSYLVKYSMQLMRVPIAVAMLLMVLRSALAML